MSQLIMKQDKHQATTFNTNQQKRPTVLCNAQQHKETAAFQHRQNINSFKTHRQNNQYQYSEITKRRNGLLPTPQGANFHENYKSTKNERPITHSSNNIVSFLEQALQWAKQTT